MHDKARSDTYSDFSPLCDFNQTNKLKSQLDFESLTLWGQSVCCLITQGHFWYSLKKNKPSTLAPQGSNAHSFIYVDETYVSEAGEAETDWMSDSAGLYGSIRQPK